MDHGAKLKLVAPGEFESPTSVCLATALSPLSYGAIDLPSYFNYISKMVAGGGFEPPGSKTMGYEPTTLPTTLYPAIDLYFDYLILPFSTGGDGGT